jgi:4a-hydroxytetrahydrobiopterin dehydratase
MTGTMTPRVFHQQDGVAAWRVVGDGLRAVFTTDGPASGAAWVAAAIERAASVDGADRLRDRIDIDLRAATVAVRLRVFDGDDGIDDTALAVVRALSALAAEHRLAADPSRVQSVQIAIDAIDIAVVMPFWQAVLGYRRTGDEDLVDPRGDGPAVWFQQMRDPRPQRNRVHVDVYVPREQAHDRIDAAVAAGGSVVNAEHAPDWWTLADPEGNEVDVAPWVDDSDFAWDS